MAQVYLTGPSLVLGADDTVVLSDASDGAVGSVMVHLDTESAGTIAVTVKARARSVPRADTSVAWQPIPYLVLTDGGVVASGATYATATLTGNDIIIIPASGLSIALDVDYTSGTHRAYVERLIGAAA